ncbi:MAG: SMP-30/gluconolactonase/LRE family protein [Deltaproteobacteria bacterium]|jgi:hypothetical protein|nr:SMP-30/gluconolactonase/LRE family protein [Deltaproteobacteria bacterium]MBT4642912.1 SMP-30/gluconolactonase/LRE family protein [Deltaproteobacteria bacterium]
MTFQVIEILKEIVLPNRDRHNIPPLDGPLQPNDSLDSIPVLRSSLESPDDILIDSEGDLIVSSGNRLLHLSAEGFSKETVSMEFDSPIGGLSFYREGQLLVCVSGKGLAILGEGNSLTWIDRAGDKSIKCPNSSIMDSDGNIYIADGSLSNDPGCWVKDLMEKRYEGRLVRYQYESDKTDVLLEGMGYPNGLCLSHDGKWIIVSESWNHSLSRYPLGNIQPHTREVLIPNLPGYPGRILLSADGGYWMCLFAMRSELIELVLSETDFRLDMINNLEIEHWIAPALSSKGDPYEYLQAGGVRQLGYLKPWAPPRSYGLVVKLDQKMEITGSLHSRADSSRHGITGLYEDQNRLIICSKGHGVILQSEGLES